MSMKWKVRNRTTGETLQPQFENRLDAQHHIRMMGPAFKSLYEAIPDTNDPWQRRILTEGLVRGDLRRIILPQISIDEYVPGDSESDNIVIAFFIKGVPEAVIPFRDFIMKCSGVIDVAYGDSDTIPDASIVYAEMSRPNFKFKHLRMIMEQVAMLTELEIEDFSLMFPNTKNRIPYSEEAILRYFESVSRKKNWQAQQKALNDIAGEDDGGTDRGVRESTASYPAVLKDEREIAAYIESVSTDYVDSEMIEEHFFGCRAVLRRVPIDRIRSGPEEANIPDKKKEKRYAKMDPATMPPLVVENGVIMDGNHRWRTAKSVGATHVPCYIVTEDDVNESVDLVDRLVDLL